MRWRSAVIVALSLAIASSLAGLACSGGSPEADTSATDAPAPCEQTQPGPEGFYGESPLRVALSPLPEHDALASPEGHRIKIGWERSVQGAFSIEARQFDGHGSATPSIRESGYPPTGMLPTSITFSEPGCWEVTARLDDVELVVVLNVT